MQAPDGERYTILRLLVGDDEFDAGYADGRPNDDFNVQSLTRCLPELRSLLTLATFVPASGERVAAIELAELLLNVRPPQQISRYEVKLQDQPGEEGVLVAAYEPVPFNEDRLYAKVVIDEVDGFRVLGRRSDTWPVDNLFRALEYLRQHHYALPVGGQPLVAGVHYVAK
jgi:hypothetical protein